MESEGAREQYVRPRHLISRGFADSFLGFGASRPRIVARRWGDFSVRNPLGAVIVVHGLAEHSGRYDPFAKKLNGHGRSDGLRMYAESLEEFARDIETYVDSVVANLPPEMPLFMFGHSMGGMLTGVFALREQRTRFAGFVFCGPGFEAGEAFGPVLIAAARLIGKVSATSGVANVDPTAVSSIEAEQQRYSRDELNCTGTVTAGLGVVLLEGVDYIQANQQRFDYPTLLFYGKHDTLVNKAGIERFYEAAKNSDKTLLVFENSRHEVFYDVDSEEAMKKVIDWLVTRSK